MRTHRQTQHFTVNRLGERKRPRAETQFRLGWLQVWGYRVMNQGANATLVQAFQELVALRMAHHKQMPHRIGPLRDIG